MSKIMKEVFKLIQSGAKALTNASTGDGFADNLEVVFKKCGLTKMSIETDEELAKFVQSIKPIVQKKTGYKIMRNKLKDKNHEYENIFIAQPYNTQACPDFLIFCDGWIYAIEIKYTTKNSKQPMLNGNFPVGDMIYIFGSYESREVTFILGRDYIDDAGAEEFFYQTSEAKKFEKTLKERTKTLTKSKKIKNPYGLSVSIRIAYTNAKLADWTVNDWFGNPLRDKVESNAIKFVEDPEGAELEEIDFSSVLNDDEQ